MHIYIHLSQSHFLIIVTSGSNLPMCEHIPSSKVPGKKPEQLCRSRVLFSHGEVRTGFEHNSIAAPKHQEIQKFRHLTF